MNNITKRANNRLFTNYSIQVIDEYCALPKLDP